MGLCDESSAAALFRELPGEFVRRQPGQEEARVGDVAKIEINLVLILDKRVIEKSCVRTFLNSLPGYYHWRRGASVW